MIELNEQNMNLEITDNPKENEDDFVIAKTREYNQPFVIDDAKKLSIYIKNNKSEITAGLTAKTYWHVLHIEFLWAKCWNTINISRRKRSN